MIAFSTSSLATEWHFSNGQQDRVLVFSQCVVDCHGPLSFCKRPQMLQFFLPPSEHRVSQLKLSASERTTSLSPAVSRRPTQVYTVLSQLVDSLELTLGRLDLRSFVDFPSTLSPSPFPWLQGSLLPRWEKENRDMGFGNNQWVPLPTRLFEILYNSRPAVSILSFVY